MPINKPPNEEVDEEAPPLLAPMISEQEMWMVRERNRVQHAVANDDKWSDPLAITVTTVRVGKRVSAHILNRMQCRRQ